jgi:predicted outer membrane protein
MKKVFLVGLAILAVSTSGALAKKATKPKAAAAATTATTGGGGPLMFGQVSAADRAMYKKNQRDSGMKK